MCLLRINLPNLCPNMIHVDALDFSEWHSEEVMFLLTLSVLIGINEPIPVVYHIPMIPYQVMFATYIHCGGAMVYWHEPLTLDQKVAGMIPRQYLALLSFSKTLYPHCCSPPRCINGYPVRCEHYLSLDVACVRPYIGAWPECSPGSWEGALWVQDWYWLQGNNTL